MSNSSISHEKRQNIANSDGLDVTVIDKAAQVPSADTLRFARNYQIEALEKALKQNTIVFLETGAGKTLIAIMLLRSFAYLLRRPSPYIAVFMVPHVVLVPQQAEAIQMHTDLKVGKYWGDMGVDFWNDAIWKQEQDKYEVLVMTPAILLDGLRHSFFKLEMVKLLIFDECHHTGGKHPYACIMTEFYHQKLQSKNIHLPKIFGMTASPVKSKGLSSSSAYWKKISELENLMDAKVYTCINESVLAEFIPFPVTKVKNFKDVDIPSALFDTLTRQLEFLRQKHEDSLRNLDLSVSSVVSLKNKISSIHNHFQFCMCELGVWMALKAAESLSCGDIDIYCWEKLDLFATTTIRNFSREALQIFSTHIPSDWPVGDDMKADVDAGFLTSKVICLIESLLEYRVLKDLRCIIFVERVITAVVLQILLGKLILKLTGWKTEYVAGNRSGLQSQSRKLQNGIVDDFRKGNVNIIVATSILEEGLDVQSCRLVIRFDTSSNVCSFIQSRGRARMQNSEFLLMLKSGDLCALSRVENFLSSGDMMREESLRHASAPCAPLQSDLLRQQFYQVESTGAIVNLTSSISLIYLYCSRLPSDGYFRPSPRFHIDKATETCTLDLPKSCPIQTVHAQGSVNLLKQITCLEACKQLHKIGALTDNLVPDIVGEEVSAQESDVPYCEEQVCYFPSELVNSCSNSSMTTYHCYLIEMVCAFRNDIPTQNVVLLMRCELESDVGNIDFTLEVERGNVAVDIKYIGNIEFSPEHVLMCRKFQVTIFRILQNHNWNMLEGVLRHIDLKNDKFVDYLLLPSTKSEERPCVIDWNCVRSMLLSSEKAGFRVNAHYVQTYNGLVCSHTIENSLVYTPHNGHVYCVDGFLHDLNGNSNLKLRGGEVMTYKNYYKSRHGIDLRFQHELMLKAKRMFEVQNYLQRRRSEKSKESSGKFVELPPELCCIILSPISVSTFYSFAYLPSILYRIESLLIAVNLKRMHMDFCTQPINIPTVKVLEAITTKKCQESFHLESLEALGDSFLKYATSQQLFKTYQNHHEGLLSIKKDKIISNASLCKLGCGRNLPGFIRNESFIPKMWIVPGELSPMDGVEISPMRKIYVRGIRRLKSKRVADVVEALIGAFLSTGGEKAAIQFMSWLGIEVDIALVPYERQLTLHPERLVNLDHLQSLLKYQFRDPSLLVEALTHGSYMLPEIPRCYERLEFLGDSVLDYLMTAHLYYKYPGMSPGLLTDLRSASVNNDCYARSVVKAGLHQHILHFSHELHKHITKTVNNFEQLSSEMTFGWESDSSFPKVLGDIIESLAGAIYVDSEYNKAIVFESIRPLLEPLITPETVRIHPTRELYELCQKKHYDRKKPMQSFEGGVASITVEVEANGTVYKQTSTASDKKSALKVACRELLKSLKQSIGGS